MVELGRTDVEYAPDREPPTGESTLDEELRNEFESGEVPTGEEVRGASALDKEPAGEEPTDEVLESTLDEEPTDVEVTGESALDKELTGEEPTNEELAGEEMTGALESDEASTGDELGFALDDELANEELDDGDADRLDVLLNDLAGAVPFFEVRDVASNRVAELSIVVKLVSAAEVGEISPAEVSTVPLCPFVVTEF